MARGAGVGRLVITHVPPWHDPEVAKAEATTRSTTAPIDLATPGVTFEVGR